MHPRSWPILKTFQSEALNSLESSRHTLLIAPTGAGKSLIFQRFIHDRSSDVRAVLVTPLVALGRQQVARFQDLGIRVWCGIGPAKQVAFPDQDSGVWVVSPERLLKQEERLFEHWRPNFFIFDEAHCVFDWGDDFRPAFGAIQNLFHRHKIKKSFWCSATLRPDMVRAIQEVTGSCSVLGKFQIPLNIELQKIEKSGAGKLEWTDLWLHHHSQTSGIIYVGTRSLAERLELYLRRPDRRLWVYHAGMSAEERSTLESKIEIAHACGESFTVIATTAFGMGMDYPKLKYAIIFDPPYSILQLAQGLGRVGRSGEPAQVFLLWNDHDFVRLKRQARPRPRAFSELLRLQMWYQSGESPKESLEKDFREDTDSAKIEESEYPKRSQRTD
ncbi:MAG: ATP-dependent DNA helicase RecQ [Bdellovibrionales bacterium]|nr:ATP-dependent DNA helicase RecQ [Bdellovibrionales bacterium]